MTLPKTALGLLALGLFLAAAAANDAEALKGEWSVTSMSAGGRPVPAEALKSFRATFDAKTYENRANGEVVEEGTYTLDPSKKPKAVDFVIKKGEDAGKTQLAIYELDGETLRMCLARPGSADRPKTFDSSPDSPLMLIVLKRAKR